MVVVMIYQVILYEGKWDKKISEKSVIKLLCHHFHQLKESESSIQFQESEEGLYVEVRLIDDWREPGPVVDRLYRCFYTLEPEYETMVEVNII